MRRCRIRVAAAIASCLPLLAGTTGQAESPCVNIYHDESGASASDAGGPINAIMLANLLGHWPQYEIRVRPIFGYKSADLEACKSTIYLGSDADSEIPEAFLRDYFSSDKRIAWVGFGQQMLEKSAFAALFKHKVAGQFAVEPGESSPPRFYQHVLYKERLFKKSVEMVSGKPEGAFNAVRFVPTGDGADAVVVAKLIHNTTYKTAPYFLRAGAKFIVGDIPFSYMHEADRYFAFADLLFDILEEPPVRANPLAFARTEDIHAFYELHLLQAVAAAHKSEGVPFSMAHIPLFVDPFNAFGGGAYSTPLRASEKREFLAFIKDIAADPRNTIVWHGVTHQYGQTKNPHTGTSGDDYEFWDMVANKPIREDGVQWTLDRLAQALPVFEAYNRPPRFWVTPHYHASALNSRVFATVFPWQIGRVTYYPSSFGPAFTISPADRAISTTMPAVSKDSLKASEGLAAAGMDVKSEGGLTQMFPFEIYRDVYGQRILPETLGYMSYATSDQTAFIRTADDMLADARRNSVIRDYWASFFYHPYVFSKKENGGIGTFDGDAMELRKLLTGLKLLGYTFTSLPEFEASLAPPGRLGAVTPPSALVQSTARSASE